MQTFLNTFTLFAVAMAIHLVIWKVRLPKRHVRTLLVIFASAYFLWLIFSVCDHAPLLLVLGVSLYYWSVSLCYTITYTGVEGDSPTLSLMRFLAASKGEGRSAEEIAGFMAARPFIGARLAALIKSGLIREENQRYVVAGDQPFGFRLILGFRKIYGTIPKGG